ncbi:MAG: STAS domain-containing protein [Planctomycetota bacterium]
MADVGGDPLQRGPKADVAHIRQEAVGDVTVFVVENENIYAKQAEEMADAIRGGIRSADRPRILVDLSAAEFTCSALMGLLIDLHKSAAEKGGDLKICVTGGHAAYTMKLVKLNHIIDMAGDRQSLIDVF